MGRSNREIETEHDMMNLRYLMIPAKTYQNMYI